MEAENFTSIKDIILLGFTSHRKIQLFLFVVLLIVYLLAVLGNLLIIILVRIDLPLQTPMYYFLSQLAGTDICYVTSTMPLILSQLLAGNGTMSFALCLTQMYIGVSLGSIESLLLGVMAFDCYLAICHPLLYAVAMGKRCQLQLTSAIWIIGPLPMAICTMLLLSQPFCGSNEINHFVCEFPVLLKLTCVNTQMIKNAIFGAGTFLLLLPLSVILTSYGFILYSVSQMRSKIGQLKAFSTCGSHLLVVILFYGPTIWMYVIPKSNSTPDHDKEMAVFYILVTPLLNPIIYTLRNKDIHSAVLKILQRRNFERKIRVFLSC